MNDGIPTVDGWNPANRLSLVVNPIIYRVLYISGGCLEFLPSTVHEFIIPWVYDLPPVEVVKGHPGSHDKPACCDCDTPLAQPIQYMGEFIETKSTILS